MQNKKMTITIGIPAYNEEANIGKLLKSLLVQKADKFIMEKIIVISDGSSDRTQDEVKKINSKKIELISNKFRQGLNPVQNQLLELCESDVLVILNADILPTSSHFVEKLIKPFLGSGNVGLVSCRLDCVKRSSFVGKILANSNEIKEKIFQKINKGSNVYLCHGQVRAFSKAFYKNLRWPYDVPEDSFSYFECIRRGFRFVYLNNVVVNFALSTNIEDQVRQSKRFASGIKILENIFGVGIVRSNYKMPILILISYLAIFMLRRPILTTGYVVLYIIIYFFIKDKHIDHSKFEASTSSKSLSI